MDTEDARRLSLAEQHERRRQVIRAYKRNRNKRQIARDVGFSYPATRKIIDRFKAGGIAARWRRANAGAVAARSGR